MKNLKRMVIAASAVAVFGLGVSLSFSADAGCPGSGQRCQWEKETGYTCETPIGTYNKKCGTPQIDLGN